MIKRNKVIFEGKSMSNYKPGELFKDSTDGEIYILTCFEGEEGVYKYLLVCLVNGILWDDPNDLENTIPEHFIPLGNREITIK